MGKESFSSPTRLIITDMILENFKSYAGIQHVGPFHKCFSSVIGPNGSGKSNVIDAMLFVFGKRAKQLRLNKVSELIHNSSNYQNLEFARVSVQFSDIIDTDDENFEVVADSNFSITRIAYRNNSSKYFIDEKTSNFTEVTSLLKKKGIDLDNNRFLILQGEVEQIAMMKPKGQTQHDEGLLEYLEDIIGTNCYIDKIEESSKMLELLNEKRVGMIHRVQNVENELKNLQSSKIEAETYFSKEGKKLKWMEKFYELFLKEEEAHHENLKISTEELEEALKTESNAVAEYSSQMEDKEVKFNALQNKYDTLIQESESCVNKFKEFERKDIKFREDSKQIKTKIRKLEEKIQKDSKRLDDMAEETKDAESAIPQLTASVNEWSEKQKMEEKNMEDFMESIKGEVEKYRQELSVARSKLDPYDKQINDHKAKADVATSECNIISENHENARKSFENAKTKLNYLQENIKQKEKELNNRNSALENLKSSLAQAIEEEKNCILEEESIEKKFRISQSKLSELSQAFSEEKSQSEMITALMQVKRSGKLPGIYGRLGDLGAIDKKYDVAISTACGALDYIVVDTSETAQACVNFLRENKLGIATFLILEKQQGLIKEMNERVSTPENVPRLFDLIKMKNEILKPAFFFALKHTLVVKDIEQGARISYSSERRFKRVVTLEGAMFESSGTMAGGGGTPRGGRMGTSLVDYAVPKADVERAEKEVQEWGERLESVRMKKSTVSQEKVKWANAMATVEMEIPKLRMEVEEMKAQLIELSQRMTSIESNSIPPVEEMKKIEDLKLFIENEEKNMQMIMSKSNSIREKVDFLQKQVEGIGSEKMNNFKQNLKNIQTKIDTDSTEINRFKVLIKNNEKNEIKLKKMLDANKDEIEKDVKLLLEKKKENKEMEKDAFIVHDNHEKLKEKLEKTKSDLDELKKEYSDYLNRLKKLKSSQVDIQFKYEDAVKNFKICEAKMRELEKKLNEAKNKTQKLMEMLEDEGLVTEELKSAMAIPSSRPSSSSSSPPSSSSSMKMNKETAHSNAKTLEEELKALNPNMSAIVDYRNKCKEGEEKKKELDEVTKERDALKQQNDDLKKRRLDEFMEGFNSITTRLKEMYQMITLGGDAELELVDSLDPFSEGIIFSVRPPKKSWKNISNLSGGEKTLSSLALVFALHHYKPTPLYVMDEIDAALDFKNVSIVAHYVKERTKNAQFIIISLRNNMFELSNRLVGIFKTDNCTKSLTVDPASFSLSR